VEGRFSAAAAPYMGVPFAHLSEASSSFHFALYRVFIRVFPGYK
jgi:hypothetical protein